MTNDTETAPDLDALYRKHSDAATASSAAFEAWRTARENQNSWADQIAEPVADGKTPSEYAIEKYRQARSLTREADVEDDRVRAIANAAYAELEAARTVTR